MPLNIIVFLILGIVVVGTALAMVLSRNAVYSALFLVLNFSTIAIFYLLLGSPFISLVQITVYAGSIMVMFLFVIMLLGAEKINAQENIKGQRLVGIILGLVLFFEAGLYIFWKIKVNQDVYKDMINFVTPYDIGNMLFAKYAFPFLITSLILVAATVGAVIFTRSGNNHSSTPEIITTSQKMEKSK